MLRKRSISIRGHRTSIALEASFWDAFEEIAAARGKSIAGLVAEIDEQRGETNLSSALRQHILAYYRARAAAAGSTD